MNEMGLNGNTQKKGFVIVILSEILFGSSFIFIRLVVEDVSVFTLLSWRSLIATIGMTACVLIGLLKVNLRGKDLKPLILLGLFQPVLYFIMETLGVRLTTAAESGTILACIPITTMTFSAIFLGDRPTKKQVVFMLLTVGGAVMIGLGGEFTTSNNLLGYLFLFLAMCSEGAYAVTSQKLKEFSSVEKTYAMVLSGMIAFTTCGLVEHALNGTMVEYITLPFRDSNFLISILFLGLGCSVIAFLLANYSISLIGATKRAALAGVASITSIVGGVFILGETFTKVQVFATVVILIGAYGVNRFGRDMEEEDNAA